MQNPPRFSLLVAAVALCFASAPVVAAEPDAVLAQ